MCRTLWASSSGSAWTEPYRVPVPPHHAESPLPSLLDAAHHHHALMFACLADAQLS
jgi:hypothetical protein